MQTWKEEILGHRSFKFQTRDLALSLASEPLHTHTSGSLGMAGTGTGTELGHVPNGGHFEPIKSAVPRAEISLLKGSRKTKRLNFMYTVRDQRESARPARRRGERGSAPYRPTVCTQLLTHVHTTSTLYGRDGAGSDGQSLT